MRRAPALAPSSGTWGLRAHLQAVVSRQSGAAAAAPREGLPSSRSCTHCLLLLSCLVETALPQLVSQSHVPVPSRKAIP